MSRPSSIAMIQVSASTPKMHYNLLAGMFIFAASCLIHCSQLMSTVCFELFGILIVCFCLLITTANCADRSGRYPQQNIFCCTKLLAGSRRYLLTFLYWPISKLYLSVIISQVTLWTTNYFLLSQLYMIFWHYCRLEQCFCVLCSVKELM